MQRIAVITATALLMTACGAGRSRPTTTSTAPAGAHVLSGCYKLPFSGGTADLRPLSFYRVTATGTGICFRRLGPQSKCSSVPSQTGQYGNPIIDTDEPRSGNYAVVYYPHKHYWFLASGCPVSPSP